MTSLTDEISALDFDLFSGTGLTYNHELDFLFFAGRAYLDDPATPFPVFHFGDINGDGYWDQKLYIFQSSGASVDSFFFPHARFTSLRFTSSESIFGYQTYADKKYLLKFKLTVVSRRFRPTNFPAIMSYRIFHLVS